MICKVFSLSLGACAGLVLTVGDVKAQCPSKFTYIGEAYAEDSKFTAESKVQAVERIVPFPRNFAIDTSYRQPAGTFAGGSAGAVMSNGDVPNGLHLINTGEESGEKGWSVHPPKMQAAQFDGNLVSQWALSTRLYCHSGSGAPSMVGATSCNVRMIVCALPK